MFVGGARSRRNSVWRRVNSIRRYPNQYNRPQRGWARRVYAKRLWLAKRGNNARKSWLRRGGLRLPMDMNRHIASFL